MAVGLRRVVAAALLVVSLAGCALGQNQAQQPPDPEPPPSAVASPSATEATEPSDDGPAVTRNDFQKTPLVRSFSAGSLTVTATYTPRLAVKEWTASAAKPVAVSLTSINKRRPGQKIYLAKVTATLTARDTSGPLASPGGIVDTANIGPGYLVSFPYTYGQNFVVPALDEGSESVTIDFTYEFLLQVDKDSRDYYKQTATDTVVVPITS